MVLTSTSWSKISLILNLQFVTEAGVLSYGTYQDSKAEQAIISLVRLALLYENIFCVEFQRNDGWPLFKHTFREARRSKTFV